MNPRGLGPGVDLADRLISRLWHPTVRKNRVHHPRRLVSVSAAVLTAGIVLLTVGQVSSDVTSEFGSRLSLNMQSSAAGYAPLDHQAMVSVPRGMLNPAHAASALTNPFPSGLPLDAPEFMANGYTPTLAQALAQAKAFTYIVEPSSRMYKAFLPQMRAVNPSLKVLVYVNGTFAFSSELSTIPASWYQLDSKGKKIQSKLFSNLLMNPANPAWVNNRAQKCAQGIADGGADGCFLDTMGAAPVTPSYVTGMPYNASTRAVWTRAQWLAQSALNGAAIKKFLGSKLVFVNGVQNGKSYFDSTGPSSQILNGVDGGLIELFVRPPTSCITCYHTEADWKADVDMLVNAGARGKTLLGVTKVWVPGTQAQIAAWDQYSMATFLLGYSGKQYFNFRSDKSPSTFNSIWGVNVGAPVANYSKVTAGYYRRDFASGIVLVNPNRGTVNVSLGGNYRTLGGAIVSSVTLTGDSAFVLVHA